jgi:ribosome-binding factor A
MSTRRAQKAAEAIREVVSMAILAELKDPRIQNVTVTYVEASADLRYAKVHVSVMGDESQQKLSLRGLQSAAGFLQAKVAQRIDLRYTPRLTFLLDQGVKRSIEIAEILQRVLPPASGPEAPPAESPASPPPATDLPGPPDCGAAPPDAPADEADEAAGDEGEADAAS